MTRIAWLVSMVALLALIGCKRKQAAPAPAASLSTAPALPSAATTPTTPSDGDFEGEIGLLAKGKFAGKDDTPINLTLLIKGNRVRADLPQSLTAAQGLGPAYVLALPADKKVYAILDAKKQAVLLELDKFAEQAKAFGGRLRPNAAAPPPTVARLDKTGKFDTVAGIKCEIWHFNQDKTEGEACIAEQQTSWLHLPIAEGAPKEVSWLSAIADGKHFPLRFVGTERGVESGRIEVTSVQRKPLQAHQFELPADYAVLSLEQMIGAMLGGLGGPGINLPPGLKLPPGVTLPPGVKLPPGVTLPPSSK